MKKKSRKKCALCTSSYVSEKEILYHYEQYHGVNIVKHQLSFNSLDEFNHWKSTLEKSTNSSFIKTSSNKLKECMNTVFRCHRSGFYNLKINGRVRQIKHVGSKKISAICPAKIILYENNINHSCSVIYIETHIWHLPDDEKELCHLYLHQDNKIKLAGEIALGVPFTKILKDQNKFKMNESPQVSKKLSLLTNKDLHNIKKTYVETRETAYSIPCSATSDPGNEKAFVSHYSVGVLCIQQENAPSPNSQFSLVKAEFIGNFMEISNANDSIEENKTDCHQEEKLQILFNKALNSTAMKEQCDVLKN